jgi:hypothetical protein
MQLNTVCIMLFFMCLSGSLQQVLAVDRVTSFVA